MKKYLFFFILSVLSLHLSAQIPESNGVSPQRTPKEIAHKQTEMMVRELNITDSVLRDTLYHLHLRYAYLQMTGATRAEHLERQMSFFSELKSILTPAQYNAFMNHQMPGPRQQRERTTNAPIFCTPQQPRGPRPADRPEYRPDNAPQDTSVSKH